MKTEDGSERHRKSRLKTDDGIAGTPTGYSLNVFPLFFHKYEKHGLSGRDEAYAGQKIGMILQRGRKCLWSEKIRQKISTMRE